MTTNPSHQTTQKRRRTRREADSDKVTRLPLSKSAERLLATLLQRDPPAPHNRLARFLHEPVLRRLLSILESPAGVPTQDDRQRTAASAEEVLSRIDELAYGEGGPEGRKQVFLALVETYALLSFAQGGIPPEPGMPLFDADAIAAELAALKASESPVVVSLGDERYPALLRTISARVQPRSLYCQGDVALLATPCIAIVGSRKATLTGIERATRLAARLGASGYTIVSGLATGIDTAAHEGALSTSGKTIAVLGTGLAREVCYPHQNAALAERIVAAGGLLITEYTSGQASSSRFIARDRIIAALALITIPIEAEKPSGTLATVHRAGHYRRAIWCPRPTEKEVTAPQYHGILSLLDGSEGISCRAFGDEDYPALLAEAARLSTSTALER